MKRTPLKRKAGVRKKSKKSISVAKLDALARDVVFQRDGHRCIRCQNPLSIQWAHVYSRRFRCVRWDPENGMTLCAGCHFFWHDRPTEAALWFVGSYPDRAESLKKKVAEMEKPHRDDVRDRLMVELTRMEVA